MTYGEIKRRVLEHINRATINGAEIPAAYNGQSDDIRRIPALINEAVVAICTQSAVFRNTFLPKDGEPCGKLIRYRLPEDFYSLWGGGVYRLRLEGPVEYKRGQLVGRDILLPPGDFAVTYWCFPERLPSDPADDYEYSMELDVLHAAMCYAAARLALTEDETVYAALMQEYRAWLKNIRRPPWADAARIPDVYGGEAE